MATEKTIATSKRRARKAKKVKTKKVAKAATSRKKPTRKVNKTTFKEQVQRGDSLVAIITHHSQDRKQTFLVDKTALSSASPILKTAIESAPYAPVPRDRHALYQKVEICDTKASLIKYMIKFFETGKVYDSDVDKKAPAVMDMARLWVLAQRFEMSGLQKAAIRTLRHTLDDNDVDLVGFALLLSYAYGPGHESWKALKTEMALHFIFKVGDVRERTEYSDGLPAAFRDDCHRFMKKWDESGVHLRSFKEMRIALAFFFTD